MGRLAWGERTKITRSGEDRNNFPLNWLEQEHVSIVSRDDRSPMVGLQKPEQLPPTTNIIVDDDHILQVSSQEPSTSSKPTTQALSAKSSQILIKLSGYAQKQLPTKFCVVQLNPIVRISSQGPLISFKPPCNRKLFLSRSLLGLNLFLRYLTLKGIFRVVCWQLHFLIFDLADI